MKIKLKLGLTTLFYGGSFFTIFLLTQALILTWLNQFKPLLVLLSMLTSLLLAGVFVYFIKKDINLLPHLNVPVLTIILIISLILIFFPHDTFGGRDEGIYANISVYLAEHGTFETQSFSHSTRGVQVESMKSHPPAYYIWLATQKMFFGSRWMLRSNVILVSLGLCSLFLVSSLLGGKIIGLITIALYSSCMPFLWFSRETMTENLAFFLLWSSILFLFNFLRTKRAIYLIGLLISGWLFSFVRLEGLLIQLSLLLAFLFMAIILRKIALRKIFFIVLIYLAFISSTFLIFRHFSYDSYAKRTASVAGAVLKKTVSSYSTSIKEGVKRDKEIKLKDRIIIFSIQMLSKYNLILVLFSIFLIIPLTVINKKKTITKKIHLISLLIIISPEFYKFVNPSVTMEQPWMYRRYLYALLPAGYLGLSISLKKIASRKLLIFLTGALLTANITLSSRIVTLKNNWLITEKIDKLTKDISSEDFVIIKDKLGHYTPASFLNYQKSIRGLYWYWIESSNWQPKERKFQGIPYKKLFLLSTKEFSEYQNFKLLKRESTEIETRQLERNCQLNLLRSQKGFKFRDPIFLPYADVITYCKGTDNEIAKIKQKLFLYELIYEDEKD